jgi:DNA-binding response OmpR family regulator
MRPSHIFVVDDEPLMAEIVTRVIFTAGYAVHTATDSLDALRRISANLHDYQVVVTDNNMPGMSGSELIQELRKAGFVGRAIMFSGNVSPVEEKQILASGIDRVFHKPSDLKLLVPAIRIAFSH